jgi:hypothetical protein
MQKQALVGAHIGERSPWCASPRAQDVMNPPIAPMLARLLDRRPTSNVHVRTTNRPVSRTTRRCRSSRAPRLQHCSAPRRYVCGPRPAARAATVARNSAAAVYTRVTCTYTYTGPSA